jgi:hypothetical protein
MVQRFGLVTEDGRVRERAAFANSRAAVPLNPESID